MDGAIAILFILTLALAALAFWAYGQNTPNKTTAMFCPYCKEIKMIPTVSIGYGECSICKRNLKSSGFTGEQWNALSSDEKEKFKKENFYTDKELQSYAEFNAKLQNQVQQMRFNIPQKCPKCQSSNWKHMGTQTKQELKSAVTIGAYTQINVEEKDTSASYVCGNCGYQITGGARY